MAVDRNALKAQRERDIFVEFVHAAGLPVDPDTVQSRASPEPDILCEVAGTERVAFELVELIDEDFQGRVAAIGRFDRLLREFPSSLPAAERNAVLEKYQHAAIAVEFRLQPLRKLIGALPRLYKWLVDEVPADANTPDFELPPDLRDRFTRIAIRRPTEVFDISASSSGYLADPTFDSVREKLLEKHYETPWPKELLAYTTIDLLLPQDAWEETFFQPLTSMLERSSFRRLWVFSLAQPGQVANLKLVHPPLNPISGGCGDHLI